MKRTVITRALLAAMGAIFLFQYVAGKEGESSPPPEKKMAQAKCDKMRWKFEKGKTINYKYEENSHATITSQGDMPNGESIERETNSSADGTFNFVSNADGTADLAISVETKIEGGGADDSSRLSPGNALGAATQKVELNLIFKPDGTVSMEDGGKEAELIAARLMLDMLFQMPPQPEIDPGDSWEKELDYLTEQDSSINGTVATTFTGWENKGPNRYAKFNYTVNISSRKQQGAVEMSMEIKGAGEWRFDTANGRLLSSVLEAETKMHSVMDVPEGAGPEGQGIHVELKYEANGTTKLNLAEPG